MATPAWEFHLLARSCDGRVRAAAAAMLAGETPAYAPPGSREAAPKFDFGILDKREIAVAAAPKKPRDRKRKRRGGAPPRG